MLSNRISRLSAPPRWVPPRVVCSALLGIVGGLGAVFLILGLVSVTIFGDFHPIKELRLTLPTATTRGVITNVAATNSSENDVTVYRYEFTFSTPDGQNTTGQSYATGQIWSEGDRVQIQYAPSEPTIARIEGARVSSFSLWAFALMLTFPIVGAVLFVGGTVRGLQQVTLLRHGEIAGAQIVSERATNVRVNNVPIVEYAYEFEAHDGESYPGSSKSLPKQRIGDEAQEPVLYLPWNPYRSTLVDGLPLRYPLDVDDFGQWTTHERIWPVVWYVLIWVGIIAVAAIGILRALGIF